MPTLLQYLSRTDPDLDRTNVKSGTNTFNTEWDTLEDVQDWSDFTYENMIAMLGGILAVSYPPDQLLIPAPLQNATRHIVDESTVSAVLLKWNHTIVEHALHLASHPVVSGIGPISWTLGAHARVLEHNIYPDWAGIDLDASFPTKNRVPGDTKVSGKWNSDQLHRNEDPVEFFKPLRQVNHYARLYGTRYAYVISDKELVCIRRSISEYEGSPLARTRPRRSNQPPTTPSRRSGQLPPEPSTPSPRNPPNPRQRRPQEFLTPERQPRPRQSSVASAVSAVSAMSIDSPSLVVSPAGVRSSPAYTDDGNPDVNEAAVEIVSIPWGETRPGHLTINLALFWLHILAALDIDLRSTYSPLGRALAEKYGLRS